MSASQADRPHDAVANGEGEIVGLAIDMAPRAVTDFAIVRAFIDDVTCDHYVGRAIQRNLVPRAIDGVFRGIEGFGYGT